ncbi:MAG: hypothetical protein J6W40_00815 [Alphaproteobacteria bacterium]|nr:hypothetical protein [Alphaproteobacteria bacterium]
MKKILVFVIAIAMSVAHAGAAVRDGNSTQRTATQKRISTTPTSERTTVSRTNVLIPLRNITNRSGKNADSADTRQQANVVNRATQNNTKKQNVSNVSARAATTQNTTITASETRTGAEYEKCKSAFFTCMDQFCALKNDDYRRCSCSNRVNDMAKQRATLNDVGEQLTVFTENLDVVGLTAAQATAMRTASEGENALSTDTSASKALLQAIMNSISGGDTTVGGKYSDLNTINMSYDLSTAFVTDANQIVSSYNGQELYSAVYPQCRHAVAEDCNNASLQRAVNAYLMAIEQDCNTVQTAIDERQSQMKAAIREGSAMLDLARVENRRKHNSDDLAACINNIEAAILSEEVCGANYHKCLDNGEYIDISTGAPIVGVVKFYELGNLLTFAPGVDAANQQLSKRANNRVFVSNFENRTKKFAKPAMDKCTEIADEAWSEYLDKAMLAIYYAQQAKVSEIKQGCFDFVSSCYMQSDASITTAMAELLGSGVTILQPDKIALTTQMCADYVDSCNNMFDGNIIEDYVNNRQKTDNLTACRAIVKQCFDKYGGAGYENFYYPYSGLFKSGTTSPDSILAGDWFTLKDLTNNAKTKYLSPCANQLTTIAACNDENVIEEAFGGFDRMYTIRTAQQADQSEQVKQLDQLTFDVTSDHATVRYGLVTTVTDDDKKQMQNRVLRSVGVATEIYNQIIDTLTIQCTNINGRFVERQFVKENLYGGQSGTNICMWYPKSPTSEDPNTISNYNTQLTLGKLYGMIANTSTETLDNFRGEDMCPRDYGLSVDTEFWGACLCWENGGRRSKNGKNATCIPELPVQSTGTGEEAIDNPCYYYVEGNNEQTIIWPYSISTGTSASYNNWCMQYTNAAGQVCPYNSTQFDRKIQDSAESDDSSGSSTTEEAETVIVCQVPADAGMLQDDFDELMGFVPDALN